MSSEIYYEYHDTAKDNRLNGDNVAAGRYYALAAYEALGVSELTRNHDLVFGIVCLMKSGICYRLAGDNRACANRCRQAILVLEDAAARLYDAEPLEGITHELIGDCMLIGDFGDYTAEYETARACYDGYESASIRWQTQDEFSIGIIPFMHVADTVSHEFDNYGQVRTTSLRARIDAKMTHFERLLDELDKNECWIRESEEEG